MKLTVRQFKLLQYINNFPDMTLEDYSKALEISIPTLKSDIKNMEKFLAEYHIILQMSGRNILQVWGKENLTHLLIDSKNSIEFSLDEQILLLLILTDDFIVLQDIADKLFVSKSKIEKLMPDILKTYSNDLQSLRHYGIRCISPEAEKRALFAKLLSAYFKGIDLCREVEDFNTKHFPILDYISKDSVLIANNVIKIIQDNKDFSFTDESACQLFLCFLLMIDNYKKHKDKTVSSIFTNIIKELPNATIYLKVARDIATLLNLDKNYNEICYICYMLMSLRKQNVFDVDAIVNQMQDIIYKILENIEYRLSIDLSQDMELVKNLSLHIYATVLRKDMLKPANLDCQWNELGYQYPVSFEMAVIASSIIKEYYQYDVSRNEMIYLTLHFQVAIERLKTEEQKIRAIVICHYGMAAATLISTKINSLFGVIRIIGCYSMHDFLNLNKHDYDLILSTEKIEHSKTPVIYVSPAVRENELEQILKYINNKNVSNTLRLIIMESMVLNYKRAKNIDEILSSGIKALIDAKLVEPEYLNSVIEREKISPTDIGCFAVPHGNPNFVNKTKLLIICLDEGVKWNKSMVKYIFLFAVSKDDFNKNFTSLTIFYKKLMRLNLNLDKVDNINNKIFKSKLLELLNI